MLHFKGFSRTAGHTLAQALRLAGKQGQPKASTGHLLMAILMQTSDPAASFLRARRITAPQVELRLQGLGQGRPLPPAGRRPSTGDAEGVGLRVVGRKSRPAQRGGQRAPALRHAGRPACHRQRLAAGIRA